MCLSHLERKKAHSRASLVSIIMESLDNNNNNSMTNAEVSNIREALLKEFSPEEVSLVGAQLFKDSKLKCERVRSNGNNSMEATPIFPIEDDDALSPVEGVSKQSSQQLAIEAAPSLLNVDQLLESAMDSAARVGKTAVGTSPCFSFNELANQCEAHQVGKNEKMLTLLSIRQRQESSISHASEQTDEGNKKEVSESLQVTNTILAQNLCIVPGIPMHCGTECQHPDSLRLPALSPFDNFLKAAGC